MRVVVRRPPSAFLRYNGTVAYAPPTSHDGHRLAKSI